MNMRYATENDICEISNILIRNFDEILIHYHSANVLSRFKAHNSIASLKSQLTWKTIYIVELEGKIIATGAFANFGTAGNPKYSVSNLYVLPDCHSNGVGKLLFQQLLSDAKENNASSFHVPSSKNAIEFYEKMGFGVDFSQPDIDDEITWMSMQIIN